MSEKPPSDFPYLHVRPPRRVVGVGGGADRASAPIVGNQAELEKLRKHIDRALGPEGGLAEVNGLYREIDGSGYDIMVHWAARPEQMGGAREPEPPDYSMFA